MGTTEDIGLRELLDRHSTTAAPELVQPLEKRALQCLACGHRCKIKANRRGICRVRFNVGGELRVPDGYVAGLAVDPIEKKPFFHALPGRDALSFGMLGCDYHCSFCQNWVSSQALRDDAAVTPPRIVTPEQLVDLAVRHGASALVSTYNEPLITADWAVKVFAKAREKGLVCGFVSNGNATPEVLDFLRPLVDLYKVDLKGFDDKRYRQLGGVLGNVLRTIDGLKERGFWVEVVTLIVPGSNDSTEELRALARFLAGVSPDLPWHVTAFHPDYRFQGPPRTSPETLLKAWEIGKEAGLHYVYAGNLPGRLAGKEDTFCPRCGTVLIRRKGFSVLEYRLEGGCCPACGTAIPGYWG
jgi:pyruvate formate lyase activating enzyme